MDLGVDVVVQRTVLGTQVFRAIGKIVSEYSADNQHPRENIQCRSSLGTELAMEDKNTLLMRITAGRGFGFGNTRAEQEVLDSSRCVDVDGAGNVATVIFVVEPAVDDLEGCNLRIVDTIQ